MIKLIYIIITICLVSVNYLSAQNDVELLGQLNPYPNLDYADIWGYAANGREYALMGVTGGTSIIDVTDPANPVEVDFITGPTAPPHEWRDIKTHLNYAYVVTMGTGSGQGLQIIDLSNLPTSASLVNTVDTWFSRAHDIFIDSGYALYLIFLIPSIQQKLHTIQPAAISTIYMCGMILLLHVPEILMTLLMLVIKIIRN